MKRIEDITIRHDLQPGDLGTIIQLHGTLYNEEFDHGVSFEAVVAGGLFEWYNEYDADKERIWIAEDSQKIVGALALKKRGDSAQLRYFLIDPEYRGIGLGNKLLDLFMKFAKECQYKHSYLWTTHDLKKAAYLYKKFGYTLTEEKTSEDFGKTTIEQRYDLIIS